MSDSPQKSSRLMFRLGIVLIILSFACWLIIPAAPFLPISVAAKATLAAGAIIVAEIMFWLGAIFVGKEVVRKYKDQIKAALFGKSAPARVRRKR